jgi:hypothetical protein
MLRFNIILPTLIERLLFEPVEMSTNKITLILYFISLLVYQVVAFQQILIQVLNTLFSLLQTTVWPIITSST